MKKYRFELRGIMPLIMHADSIEGADSLQEWRKDPRNKGVSVSGDDRTPPWTWQTYLYHDGTNVVMPAENVMVALRQAGAQLILKGKKSFKEISQSGLLIDGESCDLTFGKSHLTVADVMSVRDKQFSEQVAFAKKNGFELFMKRVRIGNAKHIRVRPKFAQWTVRAEIFVLKQEINDSILGQLFEIAGKCGLGDWRPASRTPGCYGQFEASVSAI